MKAIILAALLLFAASCDAQQCLSLDSFGGVEATNTVRAARQNSNALAAALSAASTGQHGSRQVCIFASQRFYLMNTSVSDVHNVTLRIDGKLIANDNIEAWPTSADVGHSLAVLYVSDSTKFRVTGNGTFDGQGFRWWTYVVLTGIDNRPHLVMMTRVDGVEIDSVLALNSPMYHWNIRDAAHVYIHDTEVLVDVEFQRGLLEQLAAAAAAATDDGGDEEEGGAAKYARTHLERIDGVPLPYVLALNTDGFDLSCVDVLVERVKVVNFDDAVVPKPGNQNNVYAKCSQDMLIRDVETLYTVGMTIGSVPPNPAHNCVRNVTFDGVTMIAPIKAIYLKSNPGTDGDGLIDSITYRNFEIRDAIWHCIWCGPQQQHQPKQSGTGCSWLYPLAGKCATNPRVTFSNIRFENVTATGGLTLPGVILCDPANPCTNITFDNVHNSGPFVVQPTYSCNNVKSLTATNSSPVPVCIST
jgi:Glycosyl hydrolases family 28